MVAAATTVNPAIEPVEVDLRKSYVSGGGFMSLWPRTLANVNVDPFTGHLDCAAYEAMMADSDVWAAVVLLKILVLADGIQIESCVAKPELEGYEEAKRNAEFLKRSVEGLTTPLRTVFEQMLDALVYGNKVAEITLRDGAGEDAGKLVLDSIKPKPQRALSFVVDHFWNLLGFLPSAQPIAGARSVLPREKFFLFNLHSKDSDPRGQSSLTAARDGWLFKQKLFPLALRWFHQCAIPGLHGTPGPNSKAQVKRDASGNVIKGETLTPEEAMRDGLTQYENSTVVVTEHGSEVTPLEVHGDGEHIERGFNIAGQQITKAILFQELATRDATHQTKGSSQQQQSLLDMVPAWLKSELADAFVRDVATMLLRVNFGDAALKYMPEVTLGDYERRNWYLDAQALAELAPYLTDSQWINLTSGEGIPAPEEGEQLPSRTKAAAPALGGNAAQVPNDSQQQDNAMPANNPPAGMPMKKAA